MLMLVFLVMFGPKKGSVVAYKSGWFSHMSAQAYSIINYIKYKKIASKILSICLTKHYSHKFVIILNYILSEKVILVTSAH